MASNGEVKNLILSTVEGCLAMQAEHLSGLKAGCLAKLNQWQEERQIMVARLRQAMARIQPAEVDADLRELLLAKIGCVLDREQAIFALAEQKRNGLREQLTTIRRGKRALTGYGPGTSRRPPQFVSDKG